MATITGYTAERMQAIEDSAIIDGEVVGDDLILTRYDTTTINAGSVRGPTGSPGVSISDLNDWLPIGTSLDYIETTPPSSLWLEMTGQTITNGQSLYPDFWAKIPASMKSGSNIIMPDTRKRVSVGYDASDSDFDAIGKTGGAKTHTLSISEIPSHNHSGATGNQSVSHTHSFSGLTTSSNGAHAHVYNDPLNGVNAAVSSLGVGGPTETVRSPQDSNTTSDGAHTHTVSGTTGNQSASHTHTISSQGGGAAHNNLQPYVVFLKIIKVL